MSFLKQFYNFVACSVFLNAYLSIHYAKYSDQKVQSNNFKGRSPDTVYRKKRIKRVPKGRSSDTLLIFKVLHMVTELRPL